MFEAVAQQSDPTVGVVATISLVVALLALAATAGLGRARSSSPGGLAGRQVER
jgi:ABC-type spermidine/putrescine transport system permease subunit II